MSSDATPHPLLYVVPARRAVVRETCTYDEAMIGYTSNVLGTQS